MVHCANSPQNVHEITAYRGPLQSCFASQLPPREAFGGYRTFYHSTNSVYYLTRGGRLIASPTGGAQCSYFHRKNVTGQGSFWIRTAYRASLKARDLKKSRAFFTPCPCRGGYHPPARTVLFGISPVEWYAPSRFSPGGKPGGGCGTFYHSTNSVYYLTWGGRLIASPTVTVLKRTCF